MKEQQLIIPLQVMTYDELHDVDRALVDAARDAATRAYAPYSRFSVGAALLLDNSVTVTGSNQENAAYPSGTCAERTAAYYAHSRYPDARFVTLAIAARQTDGTEVVDPISPCGACRQALVEYELLGSHDVKVILVGSRQCYVLPSVRSLLPLTFDSFE